MRPEDVYDQETIELIKQLDKDPEILKNAESNKALGRQIDADYEANKKLFTESRKIYNPYGLPTAPSKEELIIFMQDLHPELTKEQIVELMKQNADKIETRD